jgi:hypothetical protein
MRSEKLIFHIDVNSAFLSWSALERLRGQPGSLDLRTVPSAVGGDEESRLCLQKVRLPKSMELQQESLWQPHVGNVRG